MDLQFQQIEDINKPYTKNYTSLKNAVNSINNEYPNRDYTQYFDQNYYVGWSQQALSNELIKMLYSQRTVSIIQQKTSQYLLGLGKTIIPSERVVIDSLNTAFQNYIPNTGDIYGKYLVVDDSTINMYQVIVDRTISMLVSGIKNELSVQAQQFSAWDANLLGDFNPQGIRAHSTIKLRENQPMRMMFNMNY